MTAARVTLTNRGKSVAFFVRLQALCGVRGVRSCIMQIA